MDIFLSVALLCVGLALVIVSADEAIKRLLNLARYLRLSEFVVSFVLAGAIAILPELSIGVVAAAQGTSSLGYGVILGANVADLTLVIGVVTLIAGTIHLDVATKRNIRRSFIAVTLPVLLFLDGEISRIDGAILIAAFAVYIYLLLRAKHDGAVFTERPRRRHMIRDTAILLGALTLLLIGGILITDNSQEISLALGLPLFLVGLIVAIGTCLPEMVFAIRSCNKLHCNLGLGNILGNVLADSLLTIGVIALIQPIKPALFIAPLFTGLVMVVSALITYLLSRDGSLDRRDGLLLILVYAVFIAVQSALT
ncbi:sodium:calcium antiporter [Candidatus Bathyarchaeota archaeon]|nr:sodium:calcium antiporter [Candidatus Bathyarchaeota archaeon]